MKKIEQKINELGEKMMRDPMWRKLGDIDCDSKNGIIPRGLYYDESKTDSPKNIIIIGLNPGRSRGKEMDDPKKYKDYKSVVKYWRETPKVYDYKYFFEPLRNLMRKAGMTGSILWTNLVPCQNKKDNRKGPSTKTIRYSVNTYLKRQVELMPKAPIIAVGKVAFKLLAYMFFDRKIIGITHPAPTNRPAARKAYGPPISQQLVHLVKSELEKQNKDAINFVYSKKENKFLAQTD